LELIIQSEANKKSISNPTAERTRRSMSQAAQLTGKEKEHGRRRLSQAAQLTGEDKNRYRKEGPSSKRRAHQDCRKEAHLIGARHDLSVQCH